MESKGLGAGAATRKANAKHRVTLKSKTVKQHFTATALLSSVNKGT